MQSFGRAPEGDRPDTVDPDAELIDAFVVASRALVGIVARSLAGAGQDVTLPQYRALVILSTQGPQRITDLAGHLGVTASTASRMIDRLVRKRLVRRRQAKDDRRSLRIDLTESGRDVVDETYEAAQNRDRADPEGDASRQSQALDPGGGGLRHCCRRVTVDATGGLG